MNESIIQQSLDKFFTRSPIGSLDKALANNVRGIDPLQSGNAVPPNQDNQGYIFVTRPQLNMQKDNIRNAITAYGLLNEDPSSAGLAIRMLLDPRIGAGYTYMKGTKFQKTIPPLTSKAINNESPWIPFITNQAISSSGWNDKTLPMTSTDPGLYRQTYSFTDGISRFLGEWDLTINVQNTMGDIAIALFATMMDYISYIKEELMVPYFDYLINNRCDFHLRAYRVITDRNKEYVTKIMAPGAMTISSVPFGMFGDFDRRTPFSEQTKEIALRFRCMGQFENDMRLVDAFNGVTRCFNPAMDDSMRSEYMVMVPHREMARFRWEVYPLINRNTLRLEWWVPKETYQRLMSDEYNSFTEV